MTQSTPIALLVGNSQLDCGVGLLLVIMWGRLAAGQNEANWATTSSILMKMATSTRTLRWLVVSQIIRATSV